MKCLAASPAITIEPKSQDPELAWLFAFISQNCNPRLRPGIARTICDCSLTENLLPICPELSEAALVPEAAKPAQARCKRPAAARDYELALSTVTARRFCDQQEISLHTATGRSLP